MVATSSSEDIISDDTATVEPTSHHRDHGSIGEDTNHDCAEPAVTTNEQASATDDDESFIEWSMLAWWQKPLQAARRVWYYLIALVLFGLLVAMSAMDKEKKKKKKQHEDDQQSLLPGAGPGTSSPSPPHVLHSSPSSDKPATGWVGVSSKILRHLFRALRKFAPHILYALGMSAIIKFGAPPRQDQQICIARQTECGFTGNSDIYGLGIRLGVYIQWICITFTVKFLPSARRYVISGYLFYQLGMVVAMCLLFSPGTCTFTAEVTTILHFLWAGSAIALLPSTNKNTKYDPKSKYIGIDMLAAIFGLLTFIFSSWFYLRLFFRREPDFTETPVVGTSTFWLGPVKPGNMVSFSKAQTVWIILRTAELIDIPQEQPRDTLLSSFLDWNWWFAATMTTGTLTSVMYVFVFVTIYFFHINESMAKGWSDEPSDGEPLGKMAWLICFVSRNVTSLITEWYWLTRQCIVMLWAFFAIEYTLESNNVGGVRSLNSTGQIIPLTLGIATLVSVLYLWVKEFFNREKESIPEEVNFTVLEQAIGFPTATGRWI